MVLVSKLFKEGSQTEHRAFMHWNERKGTVVRVQNGCAVFLGVLNGFAHESGN